MIGPISDYDAWKLGSPYEDQDDDLDVCPCMMCGEPVVCVPDGLPLCDPCAEEYEREGDAADDADERSE